MEGGLHAVKLGFTHEVEQILMVTRSRYRIHFTTRNPYPRPSRDMASAISCVSNNAIN